MLYPAYSWAEQHGLPVIVHCGTSTFAGSVNSYGDPVLLDEVFRDFPDLVVVLAHGGRGWWYQQASFLAQQRPNVWLEVSGLPPHRLGDYYGTALPRLADKMIFGTDWPGVPGVERNARALEKVLLDAGCTADQVGAAWGGNAARVFGLLPDPDARLHPAADQHRALDHRATTTTTSPIRPSPSSTTSAPTDKVTGPRLSGAGRSHPPVVSQMVRAFRRKEP